MSRDASNRFQRQVAPGVFERHSRTCPYRPGQRRCTCEPAYLGRVRMTVEGRRKPVWRTFLTLEEARAWVAEAKSAIRRTGELPAPQAPAALPTFGEAVPVFLRRARNGEALTRAREPYAAGTIESYESAFRLHALVHIDERHGVPLADLPVDLLTTRTLQAMVNSITTNASASLARVADAATFGVLRDLYERGILDEMPARPTLPPPPKARDKRLTVAEVDRLVRAAQADDRERGRSLLEPLAALLSAVGLRINEALRLTWGPDGLDLGSKPPRVTSPRTKTDASVRTVGLDRETAAILRRHRAATKKPRAGSLVFTREDGRPLTRDGRVRSGITRVAKAAGVDPGFHLLRHTSGSLFADAGLGAHDIAARLGHTDPAFTQRRYVHTDRSRLAEAPDALTELRKRERKKTRDARARRTRKPSASS